RRRHGLRPEATILAEADPHARDLRRAPPGQVALAHEGAREIRSSGPVPPRLLAHLRLADLEGGQQLAEPVEVARAVVADAPEPFQGVVALGDGQAGGALEGVIRRDHAADGFRRGALDLGGPDHVLLLHHDAGGVAEAVGNVHEGELARAPQDEIVARLSSAFSSRMASAMFSWIPSKPSSSAVRVRF